LYKKVAIIGSGFGGLSAAIRLQSRGFQVTIFEKNEMVGGHAYQLKKDGYTFDMGPSLITAPDIIQKVFRSAGRKMENYIDLISLDPYYRIYFHDKSFLDYNGDSEHMKKEMSKFNINDARNYDSFMNLTSKLYDAVITDGLGSTPFMSWKTMIEFMPKALKLRALYPCYSLVKKYFKDFRHRFSFSFHPLFIGGSPFRSPAVYLMIPYLEKKGGVWFTPGGMYSLVKAFETVFIEQGGIILTNSEVNEIVVKNNKAVGIQVGHEFYPSDIVISNADFAHTQLNLIQPEARKKWHDRKVKKLGYSMSAFLIYLGVRKQYPELLHHTLILSERYRELVKDVFDRKILPDDFSMYLHIPSRTDVNMAPPGCESMYVLVPVPNLDSNIDWNTMKKTYADKIINYLENEFGLKDLSQNIDVLEIFTPEDFKQRRNNHLGSAWGVEPKLTQTAIFRPHNKSDDIEGLYFVGTNTHPGAGVPGVLLTAETTEYLIVKDFQIEQNKVVV
jgi:phytoene desaturase